VRLFRPGAVARPARHMRLHLDAGTVRADAALRHRSRRQARPHAPGAVLALSRHHLDRHLHRGLSGGVGMNEHTQDSTPDAQLRMQEHREFRTYVWGLGLALLLTLVPFALVYWAVLPYLALLSVIGVL